MGRRYEYSRISADDLSYRLNMLAITAHELARRCGAREDRVMMWLDGREDIPPHIDLLTLLWMNIPGAGAFTEDWVAQAVSRRKE